MRTSRSHVVVAFILVEREPLRGDCLECGLPNLYHNLSYVRETTKEVVPSRSEVYLEPFGRLTHEEAVRRHRLRSKEN